MLIDLLFYSSMPDLDPVVAVLLIIWLTLFGACLGSFLNVVVYRLPLGKSLSNPPSHCPKCNHPIRWYDNVPVFGWLILRGKCRDCKESINIRYPLVEAICGGIFCTISILVLKRGGDASLMEVFWLVFALSGLVLIFFAAGLIEQEGKLIPWRLLIPVAVLAPMMPFLWNDSFHIMLFNPFPQTETDSIEPSMIFWGISYNFLVSMIFFFGFINEKQGICLPVSTILLSFYLGLTGILVILLVALLLLTAWLLSLQKYLTPHLTLAFSAFLFIVLILSVS